MSSDGRSDNRVRWGVLGRHSLPDKKVQWLVCNYLAWGSGGEPSVVRECRMIGCDTSVYVPALMLDLIESGELWPRCWGCHVENGGDLKLHPAATEILASRGRLEEAQAIVDDMNEVAREERETDKMPRTIDQDEQEDE